MHSTATSCLNCGAALQPDYKYCPRCSQSTHLHRFSIAHIGHEAFHAVTHTDKTMFGLLRDLALRPGHVAREYIVEGKRKKYFNPFTFLLLVLGLTLVVYTTLRPFTQTPLPPPTAAQLAELPPKQREATMIAYRQQVKFMKFSEDQAKLTTLSIVPIVAFVFWLCFRRRGLNYAEHVVMNVQLISIITLWSLGQILLFQTLGISMYAPYALLLNYAIYIVYYALGYKQLFATTRPLGWPKAIGIAVLAFTAYLLTTGILAAIYMFYIGMTVGLKG